MRDMPIRLLIKSERSFSRKETQIIVDAFEETLRTLNLVDRTDPVTQLIANELLEFAKRGERDPVRLRDRTIAAVMGK